MNKRKSYEKPRVIAQQKIEALAFLCVPAPLYLGLNNCKNPGLCDVASS